MDAFYSLQFCFRERHSTNHALITLYNVCSVDWRVFSTSRDTMSTSGAYHEYIGGVQYIGGISWTHWGDTMSTSGDVQYIGGCSVHWGISWCMWGIPWVHWGMFSTSGEYHEYIGAYHEYIRRCSVHWGMFSTLGFSLEIERFLPTCSPHASWYPLDVLNIPNVLMVSPNVLMVSPDVLRYPPLYWTSSDVLMYPPHASWYSPMYGTPPMYSWYPPDVLMVSPNVLNIHYTGC